MAEQSVSVRMSDANKGRWDANVREYKELNPGANMEQAFEVLLDAKKAQSLTSKHPEHAATLRAYDDLTEKIRKILHAQVIGE